MPVISRWTRPCPGDPRPSTYSADNEWVAVRDVIEVDGTPVTGREDLRALLSKRQDLRGIISQVVARNARYNIGQTTRNFNEPTLPLLLVEAKRINEVKFERRAVSREGGVVLATIVFAERGRPTLVRGPEGSMPAKGEIVVEAGTGIVRKTTFELDKPAVKVKLTTEYALDQVDSPYQGPFRVDRMPVISRWTRPCPGDPRPSTYSAV